MTVQALDATRSSPVQRQIRFRSLARDVAETAIQARRAGVQASLSAQIASGLREAFREGYTGPDRRKRPAGDHPALKDLHDWIHGTTAEILLATGAGRDAGDYTGLVRQVSASLEDAWAAGDRAGRGLGFAPRPTTFAGGASRPAAPDLTRSQAFRTLMSRAKMVETTASGRLALIAIEKGGQRVWREAQLDAEPGKPARMAPLDYPDSTVRALLGAGLLAARPETGCLLPTDAAAKAWERQRPKASSLAERLARRPQKEVAADFRM